MDDAASGGLHTRILGIDVGGTFVKAGIVDLTSGTLAGERLAVPTPETFRPAEMVDTLRDVVKRLGDGGPVGVGFPSTVAGGVVQAPPTTLRAPGWVGFPLADELRRACRTAVAVLNDADAAGLAEMKYGAGRGEDGVVLVVTLGTGIGSALFSDGVLVPNLEFGLVHLPGSTEVVEHEASERVRRTEGLDWAAWGARLDRFFRLAETVFSPRLVIVGGEVSGHHEEFFPFIEIRARLVPAELRNDAGIVGAAIAAAAPS